MASESKESERNLDPAELPTMRGMYAISHILELIHDFIKSRGPGVNIDNLELDDDIDFNILYDLIPDERDKKEIMPYYNKQPRVYATLRNLLIDIATNIKGKGERVTIEDAGCICIGELKRNFGYFGGRNPYTSETSYSHRIPLSNFTLKQLLQKLGVTHFFTEATGSASKTLLSADIGERVIPTSVVADPGGRLPGNPKDGSSFKLAIEPILGDITVTFIRGRTIIEFSNFPGIEISRLPSVYIATALASLIPNFIRDVTQWRRVVAQPDNSLSTNFSESIFDAGTATGSSNQGNSNSRSGVTPLYAQSESSVPGPSGTPQTRPLPSLEAYVEGRSSDGSNDIELHIGEWLRRDDNLSLLTSDANLTTYITLIKAYLDNYIKSARAHSRNQNRYDSDFDPKETKRFLETIQELVSEEEEEEEEGAAASGRKRGRNALKTYEHISLADRKNICRLALAILQRCLERGEGSFKHRIQTAIRTILTLKSLGDRMPMEELMTFIGDGETCAIASIDKLFLANCILYANITGRHVITIEVVKKDGKSSMLIIDHDGSKGATLTDEQRKIRDEERAEANKERAVEQAKRNKEAAAVKEARARELAVRRAEQNKIRLEGLHPPRKSYRGLPNNTNELRQQRQAIIADFNSTNPTQNIIEVPDDGRCFLNAVILAGGYGSTRFNEFNRVIENPPWGGSPQDIQRLSGHLSRDILVIIQNPGGEGYVQDEVRRFPDTDPIYIFDYQNVGSVQRHFDAVVRKAVGGFRSHRQRKTLKKRKAQRFTRRT